MTTLPAVNAEEVVIEKITPCKSTDGKHFPIVIEWVPLNGRDEKTNLMWPIKLYANLIVCAFCDMKFDNKKWVTLR